MPPDARREKRWLAGEQGFELAKRFIVLSEASFGDCLLEPRGEDHRVVLRGGIAPVIDGSVQTVRRGDI